MELAISSLNALKFRLSVKIGGNGDWLSICGRISIGYDTLHSI